MFGRISPLFCSLPTVEAQFRRALGSQNILLDLVPVKKPLIDGSLSWFIDANIEIVIVHSVSGTSSDLVAERVKRQALQCLQKCGEGDAIKGCDIVRQCFKEATVVRALLPRLGLQVRLLLSNPEGQPQMESLHSSSGGGGVTLEPANPVCCSIYRTDAWEPHPQERHLGDVRTGKSLENVLNMALDIVQRDAESKERQYVSASESELNLVFSWANVTTAGTSKSFSSHVEFCHMRCKNVELCGESAAIAASWTLRDDLSNMEGRCIPLVPLKDKNNLVHGDYNSISHKKVLDNVAVSKLFEEGLIISRPGLTNFVSVMQINRSLWSEPLLQAVLLQVSGEILCGRWCPARAEDYIRSCGRLVVDVWLSERGRVTTVPMMPRYLRPFSLHDYLLECLPLEFGSRMTIPALVGEVKFDFYVAAAPGGRVAAVSGCFNSLQEAGLVLTPWYLAMPLSSNGMEVSPMGNTTNQRSEQRQPDDESHSLQSKSEKLVDGSHLGDCRSVTLQILDVEATLKKLGVSTGKFANNSVEYYDSAGRLLFVFKEMDSLKGITRLIKRSRWSEGATFVPLSLSDSLRAPLNLVWHAMGNTSAVKDPPYLRKMRLPVPLLPGAFFILRFSNVLGQEVISYKIYEWAHQLTQDSSKLPTRRLPPCFFNRWRLTRSIILSIMQHDPLFHYVIEHNTHASTRPRARKSTANGGEQKSGKKPFILKMFSGEVVVEEAMLDKENLLLEVRNCLARYASRWSVVAPTVEEASFPAGEVMKSASYTHRRFVSWFLHSSDVFLIDESKASLSLQITTDVTIDLATVSDISVSGASRDKLCKLFLERQFPLLLSVVDILRRLHFFLCNVSGLQQPLFRCVECDSSPKDAGDGRKYRGDLVDSSQTSGGTEKMVVLHTAVGSSRMAALEELLRVCCKTYGVNQMDVVGTESCTRAVDAPTNSLGHCANTTIACYQRMLAEQRGFSHVVHEYDAASDTLTVKGFPKNGSNSSGDFPVVIRVVALKKRFPLIFSIHRYYRSELGLPDIPRRWDEGRMRILSIREIYKECGSHFSSPLPPEGDALTATHGKSGWTITLRLPSSLFELQTPKHLEFTHFSAGKHDGRRDVMCLFYRALHGTLNAQLMVDPPRPAGCGFKENANSTRTSAEGKLALPQARINSTKHDNMYNTLQQLIKTSLKSHVGYEGRVECRLSYMSGITFKYISLTSPESELVDLFHGYFHVDEWLPFQLLSALMSCARRLLTAPELEASLLDRSVTWPSLFLEGSSGERLFCTTFLRRYFGFHVYDADDVDELPSAPGTLYLVERTRSVTRGRGIVQFEATLALLQAPHPPATSAFTKILSSHCNVTASRAQAGMWSQVSQRLVRQQAINTAQAVDEAVIATVGAASPNTNIG